MIRVLVVEDDKLARKGLIHAMPWSEYGMSVVGEASSGQAALDFLATNEVDLALTDFAMPGLTGGDLMRIARERFPGLRFVVLTFHQELEYAQEAFRLGALDYIAKVQLEKEGFDDVLGRIRGRFLEDRERGLPERAVGGTERLPSDRAYAFLSPEECPSSAWIESFARSRERDFSEIGTGVWLWAPPEETSAGAAESARTAGEGEGWVLLELTGLSGSPKSRVANLIRKYRATCLFYEFERGSLLAPRSITELEAAAPAAREDEMGAIEGACLAFEWIYDEAAFALILGEIRGERPSVAKLSRLLVEIEGEWNRIFCPIASMRVQVPEPLLSWREAESWLKSLREAASLGNKRLTYAGGVLASVMRAARIVEAEMGGQLLALDVARRVNMSRGYFCRCFKDIIGKPFNDYLQCSRVEKAKLLLIHTDAQLSQIAEQVGYSDEKYFAKVFRELAGLPPSGFRQAAREGRHKSSRM